MNLRWETAWLNTWSSGWILTWYIWRYRSKIIRRLNWINCIWWPWRYAARSLTKLETMDGISLCTYDGKVPRSSDGSTKINLEVNFEVLLIGAWIGSLDGMDLGTYDDNALRFWDGKLVGTELVAMDGFTLGTYDVTYLLLPEVPTEGATCGNL